MSNTAIPTTPHIRTRHQARKERIVMKTRIGMSDHHRSAVSSRWTSLLSLTAGECSESMARKIFSQIDANENGKRPAIVSE